MLTDEERVNLKYDTFNKKLSKEISDLFEDEGLADVSILCEGRIIKAHKLILCLASEKLKNILQVISGQYPVIVFHDLKYSDVLNILQFIYKGEVQLERKKLDEFLKAAYCLGIEALIQTDNLSKSSENNYDLEKTNTNSLNDEPENSQHTDLYNIRQNVNIVESTNESLARSESCNIENSSNNELTNSNFINIDNIITNIKEENNEDTYEEIENECSNHLEGLFDDNRESLLNEINNSGGYCEPASSSSGFIIENSQNITQDSKKRDVWKNLFVQKFFALKKNKKESHFSIITRRDYQRLLDEVNEAKTIKKKSALHYRRLKRFDIINNNGVHRLIEKNNTSNIRYFLPIDEIFDVLEAEHILAKHGGRDKLRRELRRKYVNVTKEMITYFLSLCKVCQVKKANKCGVNTNKVKYFNIKPAASNE